MTTATAEGDSASSPAAMSAKACIEHIWAYHDSRRYSQVPTEVGRLIQARGFCAQERQWQLSCAALLSSQEQAQA